MLYEEQQPQRRPADPVPLPLGGSGGGGGEAEAVPPMFLCPITQVRRARCRHRVNLRNGMS